MCIKNLTPASSKMKAYTGLHSEHLGGRSSVVTVAQVLGGGSSVNYLMYTRACASYVTTVVCGVVGGGRC